MKCPPTSSQHPTTALPSFDPMDAWRAAAERNRIRAAEKKRNKEAAKLLAEIEQAV